MSIYTLYARVVLSKIEWRTSFNNPKFVFKHSFSDSPSMNFWLIHFFASTPYVSQIHRESRDSTDIRLPASSHLSDFRIVQKHSSSTLLYEATCSHPTGVRVHDLLYFCVFYLLLLLRGRRWKRWLRGSEKLIISDTNLSGLLGGW